MACARRSTSIVARSATCHETFHDARHHSSWRLLPSNSSSPNKCHVPWHVPLPPTVAAHTPPPPLDSSQTTHFLVGTATAPCTTTTTTTTARRRVRHSTRQLLADTFHRRVSWRHSSEPRSPHSVPLSRLNLRCHLQSISPASQRNCKGKPIPAAHTNKTCVNNALKKINAVNNAI